MIEEESSSFDFNKIIERIKEENKQKRRKLLQYTGFITIVLVAIVIILCFSRDRKETEKCDQVKTLPLPENKESDIEVIEPPIPASEETLNEDDLANEDAIVENGEELSGSEEALSGDDFANEDIVENDETSAESEETPDINVLSGVQKFTVSGVSFNMVKVAGGSFRMGATSEQSGAESDEYPIHSVTLSDFMIGETEVTQELWQAVMGSNPSGFVGNKRPVESVSWKDCMEFIRRLNRLTGRNFRLPTEAEWEFAARGGNKSKQSQYSGNNNTGQVAWFADNSGGQTHEVGTLAPNELGIYDMSGNVWEWCSDRYGAYTGDVQVNPKGHPNGSNRVIRGGAYSSNAPYCRVAERYDNSPVNHGNGLGLRLAL